MSTLSHTQNFTTFSPDLKAGDGVANTWMRQVTLRLRREVAWRWHQQGVHEHGALGKLPPLVEQLSASLDLTRYWAEKRSFFERDATAQYLSNQLSLDPFQGDHAVLKGSFGWVVATLDLDAASAFVLALGLMAVFDPAAGPVIAACLNESNATQPTLDLAQQLWDEPEHMLAIADPSHPLWRYGLLQRPQSTGIHWHTPLAVSPTVANALLFPHGALPQTLKPLVLSNDPHPLSEQARLVSLQLQARSGHTLRIVPVCGETGSAASEVVQAIAQAPVVKLQNTSLAGDDFAYFKALATLCWLKGLTLFMSNEVLEAQGESCKPSELLRSIQSIPIKLFLEIRGRSALSHLPPQLLLPMVEVPRLDYGDRVAYWKHHLAPVTPDLEQAITECARRFRYEKKTIQRICSGLKQLPQNPTASELKGACRAELDLDMGELAQTVTPRFQPESLVLPPKQQMLFQEIDQAMRSLTQVHYGWGTSRVWNECGISVLFAGPPGTGKTMAAEVLAVRLDLPMYRIDLSQVVNKYIGETEKNLKKLFDLADSSDTILFFDEADALFGKRTEVKDAHDRYANLEISYLLERMERFKGLAILATNRKKDLDEAFLRRLRYIVDFPLPDIPERRRIWQQSIPPKVDGSALDLDFFARQFPLAGGHIRSIVFNACLQTANGGEDSPSPRLGMEQVAMAVKREYDKLNRTVSLEQFGPYAKFITGASYE
jgi:ATPase family associated with various cellular activities (AAA)